MTDLISDLLALRQVDVDGAPARRAGAGRSSQVVRLIESTARKRQVAVDAAGRAPTSPPVWADPDQMKQIVLNLVLNAIDASPAGSERVAWTCRAGPRDHVTLEVRDQGAGIPAEQLESIFHPFFTTKEQGTGLGLALVHQMVVEHGGEIVVDSEVGTRHDVPRDASDGRHGASPYGQLSVTRPHGGLGRFAALAMRTALAGALGSLRRRRGGPGGSPHRPVLGLLGCSPSYSRGSTRAVIRLRWAVLVALLGITGVLGRRRGRLHVEANPDRLLPQEHPYIQTLNDLHRTFGDKNLVVVGLFPHDGACSRPPSSPSSTTITERIEKRPRREPGPRAEHRAHRR